MQSAVKIANRKKLLITSPEVKVRMTLPVAFVSVQVEDAKAKGTPSGVPEATISSRSPSFTYTARENEQLVVIFFGGFACAPAVSVAYAVKRSRIDKRLIICYI